MDESEKPDRPERSADEATEFRAWANQNSEAQTGSENFSLSKLPRYILFAGLIWSASKLVEASSSLLDVPLISWIPPVFLVLLGAFLWLDQSTGNHFSESLLNFIDNLHRKQYPVKFPVQEELDSREAYFAFLGVSQEASAEALRFTFRWYSGRKLMRQIGLAVLAWVGVTIVAGINPGLDEQVVLFKFLGSLLLAGAGLGFIYGALLVWFNATTLLITQSEITVSHSPLPSIREISLPVKQVSELETYQEHRNTTEGLNRAYIKLVAVLNNQKEIVLVRHADEYVVNYTRLTIEPWISLDIQDQPG